MVTVSSAVVTIGGLALAWQAYKGVRQVLSSSVSAITRKLDAPVMSEAHMLMLTEQERGVLEEVVQGMLDGMSHAPTIGSNDLSADTVYTALTDVLVSVKSKLTIPA